MNPPTAETGSQLITLLASLMLVLQLLLAVQRMLVTNIRIFALQSLLLAAIAGVVHDAARRGTIASPVLKRELMRLVSAYLAG